MELTKAMDQASDGPAATNTSVSNRKSSLSSTGSARIVGFVSRAWRTKSISRKITEGHGGHPEDHEWMFQFIDIIYVATIFNVSHMITECGPYSKVYVLAISIFAIMFNTRQAFDAYSSISGAKGVLHLVAFSIYGAGLFIMTCNIFETTDPCNEVDQDRRDFGYCVESNSFQKSFAAGFILTRGVLIVMYLQYFFYFHEANVVGSAPDVGAGWRELDLQGPARELRKMSHAGDEVSNPIDMTRPTEDIINVMLDTYDHTRKSIQAKHFSKVVWWKVAPAVINIGIMLPALFGAPVLAIYPAVAGLDMVFDFLIAFWVSEDDWKVLTVRSDFAMERLSLFFMLVLGEAMLGLAIHHVLLRTKLLDEGNGILLMSYFIVFSVGLQFSEHIQEDEKGRGRNPLTMQTLSPFYVWLIWLISVFTLLASNGLVWILLSFQKHYGESDTCPEEKIPEKDVDPNNYRLKYAEQNVSYGLAAAITLIMALRLMDTSEYRQALVPHFNFCWSIIKRLYGEEPVPHNENSTWLRYRIVRLAGLRWFIAIFQATLWKMTVHRNHDEILYTALSFVYTIVPNLVEVVLGVRAAITNRIREKAANSAAASVE